MLTMQIITIPVWAKPFERNIELKFGNAEYERVLIQYSAIMDIVQQAIQTYVNDSFLTADTSGEGFPARERLTGEYYISSESYWVNDEPWFGRVGRSPEYRFSITVHCLEKLRHPNQQDQDYLGLEVHFSWLPDLCMFEHHGDVDSSSI